MRGDSITKVLGPYTKNDGRQFVIVYYEKSRRRFVSYPKHIMEQHLGRQLDPDQETVHHKDGNFLNNAMDNLEILARQDHSAHDARKIKSWTAICPWCGVEFHLSASQIAREACRKKHGRAGPFCSYSCTGKYAMERRYRNCEIVRGRETKVFEKRGKEELITGSIE